jgi:hypothetical protein
VPQLEQCARILPAADSVYHDAVSNQHPGPGERPLRDARNPNDLAFSILLLLPFALLLIHSESWLNWKTIVCAPVFLIALIKTLRLAPWAALQTLTVCFVIIFINGQMKD